MPALCLNSLVLPAEDEDDKPLYAKKEGSKKEDEEDEDESEDDQGTKKGGRRDRRSRERRRKCVIPRQFGIVNVRVADHTSILT